MELSLDVVSLTTLYGTKQLTPAQVVREIYRRIAARGDDGTWIHLIPEAEALRHTEVLDSGTPLYGVPFAIKDNIDAAGHPTTAACPAYAYTPKEDATVVAKLRTAGAILIGKTNMDQFATGLVGVRSPYGAVKNAFDPEYISGGSSAGSAVAVSAGLVSFSLGTDTAGSGRVPAAFNNLVGLKPTRGLVSAKGVVPACQSLDCVSIFALTVGDAYAVLEAARGFDAADPYSRSSPEVPPSAPAPFRFGVPLPEQLQTFTDAGYEARYYEAASTLEELGGVPQRIDFSPFHETAGLLYGGPWVSERVSAIETFYRNQKDALHPVLRTILESAERYSATDVFNALHRLKVLRRRCDAVWSRVDLLLTPTASRIFRIIELDEEPLKLNSELGFYTNFVNLLDLSALALPAGFGDNGLPFGITLSAPAWGDQLLGQVGQRFQRANALSLGATRHPLPDDRRPAYRRVDVIQVAVFGAHLAGQPLNYQLTERGASFVKNCLTAPAYKLYALEETHPVKPGLVRDEQGSAVEAEVWEMPVSAFGGFVDLVPSPLSIGTIELGDGTSIKGFLCEGWATEKARDITHLGGWRAYLNAQKAHS